MKNNTSALQGSIAGHRFRPIEFLIEKSIAITAFVSFAFIFLILLFIFRESFPLVIGKAIDEIGNVNLKNLFAMSWIPVSNFPQYGLLPLIVGSIKVTVVSMCFAFPIAILAALYTSFFANRFAKEIMKPAIEILQSNFVEVRTEIHAAFEQWGEPIKETGDLIVERTGTPASQSLATVCRMKGRSD